MHPRRTIPALAYVNAKREHQAQQAEVVEKQDGAQAHPQLQKEVYGESIDAKRNSVAGSALRSVPLSTYVPVCSASLRVIIEAARPLGNVFNCCCASLD